MSKTIKTSVLVKQAVYADLEASPAVLVARILEMHQVEVKLSTVATYRTDFLDSLEVLKTLGAFGKSAPDAPKKKAKRVRPQSRSSRWADACARGMEAASDLNGLKEEYQEWLDNLPENLQNSPVGEKLQAVCDLDTEGAEEMFSEAEGIDLPLGFGRD